MSLLSFKDIDCAFPVNKSGPVKIKKVISNGQTGASSGGLRAAKFMDLKTGGTIPKSFSNKNETKESILKKEFNLIENKNGKNYKEFVKISIEQNVLNSDFSLLFGDEESIEYELTKKFCNKYKKYYLCIYSIEKLFLSIKVFQGDLCLYCICGNNIDKQKEIKNGRPIIVNVSGNRENTNPGIELRTYRFVKRFLQFHG